MIVTLIKYDRIYSVTLPEKIKGRYWISDIGPDEKKRELLSVEGIDNQWLVKGNKKNKSYISGLDDKPEVCLNPQTIYNVVVHDEPNKIYLFCEEINESRQKFTKYVVRNDTEITIGRAKGNTICVDNKFVSSNHARLTYFDGVWTISDLGSTNGIFVNDYRVSTKTLVPGDLVYIMGFKIAIGSNFIAVNNPDNSVYPDTRVLFAFAQQEILPAQEDEVILEDVYFYRSPRFKRDISETEIKIDLPPEAEKINKVPAALLIGPAITMGMASMSTGIFTVINTISSKGNMMTAMPTLVMAGSMLLGMLLWPTLTRRHEKKEKEKNERIRQARYKDYLFSIKDIILKEVKLQSDILYENNVSLDECIDRIVERRANLWERVAGQDDFLQMRVGLGNLPFAGKIQCPERKFSINDDNLMDELYALINEPKQLNMVPITYSFSDSRVSGIIGQNKKLVIGFVQSLIVRMVALHSYDELKIVLIADDNNKDDWTALKWIPHMWDNEKNIRYFVTTLGEAKEVSSYFEKIYYERNANTNNKENSNVPYYLIINVADSIAEKTDIIGLILKNEKNLGFGIINVDSSLNNLPKESSMVIEIGDKNSKIYDKNDISGKCIEFVADIGINMNIDMIAKAISNISMDISNQRYALPGMLTFLEMFEVGKIEHLNPLMRWRENNPTVSLAAPIGVDTMGELFYLDLHEKFQGPHGLVAGMTGSGKSEFIITYILSMAVNYHPDEVAFILIDYKGGGLTGAFENEEKGIKLPHLAGTITNLDGAAVKRSLISIQSELRRRQAVFNEARKISNEGTMDIYKYQKLYRDKVVTEAVPHLFIISDEFAELKSQQPEFMEQLISAARIGRSLGVHLILATQKPSGVVDDQIWSNSRFRVCLKVQERADSNDMIKRPDAAELSNTGRFYLQVGFNEFFALGQSAWCGAPYYEDGTVEKNTDNGIKVIDNIGRVIKEVKPTKKDTHQAPKTKQIVAMVKYLSDLAREEHIKVRPLWLDAIPAYVFPEELIAKYNVQKTEPYILKPVIGELDDPFNQSQKVLTLPISEGGNTIIYGVAGSGKLTFITTMVYELIRNHSAEYLNLYILDFGAETLKMFEKAPQVGGVLLSSENEKVINLMKMLKEEVALRKKLFVEYGGDYQSYVKNSGKSCPNIVVVINNYAAFSEMYDACEEVIAYITREGTKYGIYMILTATNTGAVRYRMAQNFKSMFVLQMNDKTDYTSVLGPTEGTFPSPIKGRGLIKNEHTYEFQTATVAQEDKVQDTVNTLISGILDNYNGEYAKKIPVLPEKVDREFIADEEVTLEKFPIGVDKKSLSIVRQNIKASYISFVLAQDIDNVSAYLQGFAEIASMKKLGKVVVIDCNSKFIDDTTKEYEYINDNLEQGIVNMFEEVLRRHKAIKEYGNLDTEDHAIYIINSMSSLLTFLSADGVDKLKVLLDKGREELKVSIIIGDTGAQISKMTFEDWYKAHCTLSQGVWIGDGVSDQYVLKITKITNELYKEIEQQFGMYINKGKYVMMKHIISTFYVDEEE